MTESTTQLKRDSYALTREHAVDLDKKDPLRHLRSEFFIPTKADLKRKTLVKYAQNGEAADEPSIYLCGNSLGLQPRRVAHRINDHLAAWASKGVFGHFRGHEDTSAPPFLYIDNVAAGKLAPLVGAKHSEVAAMETLTANLHLLMASFYRPTKEKYKIILEGKAFPSDHYAIESQIIHHGLDPKEAMILIEPPDPSIITISTSHIISIIDEHAASTGLVLLPGIQYFTGQWLDIKTITKHAHSKGLIIGWDLAHAVGNVVLHLHDWDVDFAVWVNYKYVNSGPGCIAGLFVHERYGKVDMDALSKGEKAFHARLSGWWGGNMDVRFDMGPQFVPIPGAAGYQVGNPSALALTSLLASLEIFAETDMAAIRAKSVALTGYLEELLLSSSETSPNHYRIITPSNPDERGAQLSVLIEQRLLDGVLANLEDNGVVVDERKPDIIRVAPVALYNSFTDVWDFVKIFKEACQKVAADSMK